VSILLDDCVKNYTSILPVISMAVDSGDGIQSKVLVDDKDSVLMAEKNVAQCVKKIEPSSSLGLQNLQRRVSPRLQNMPDDEKPFYGSNRKRLSHGLKDKVSEKGIKVEFVEDIRSKENVAQCVEKIEPNSSQRRQNLQQRISPRLQNIPDDQKPFYGSNRKRLSDGLKDKVSEKGIKVEFVEDIRSKENVAQCVEKIEPNSSQRQQNLQQRISPRLQNIPDDQKPFYGSNRKRLSDGLKDKVSEKGIKVELVEDIRCKENVVTAKKNVAQCVEKIEPNRSRGLQNLQRRVSPRLQNIPDDQKTFYGNDRKRLSDGLKDKVSEKGIKVELVEDIHCKEIVATVKKNVAQFIKKIEPNSSQGRQNLQQRISPRLQNIPDDQKPFYGSNRKRLLDGLEDKVSEKRTKVVSVEDIRCRSDLVTGHNSDRAQVDNSDKSVARVKRTLRVFNKFYLRFVQVISDYNMYLCVSMYVCV
jgi:CII-binding regulator of phage lambda lysogenization HflD